MGTKVKVVWGPPLSGKTTFVKKHRKDNDLTFDFDDIMACLTGLPYQTANLNLVAYVVDIRNLILVRLQTETKIDTAYIITTFVTDELKNLLRCADVEYVKIDTPKEECLRRLEESNRTDKEKVFKVIDDWYRKDVRKPQGSFKRKGPYEGKKVNKFYTSTKWRSKRIAILKRDEYQCRECRRYGKATQADMVHHVYPMETHPKLAFNNDNLISLCNRCHEKMHNRFDRGFTDKGKEWMDRLADKLIPPT